MYLMMKKSHFRWVFMLVTSAVILQSCCLDSRLCRSDPNPQIIEVEKGKKDTNPVCVQLDRNIDRLSHRADFKGSPIENGTRQITWFLERQGRQCVVIRITNFETKDLHRAMPLRLYDEEWDKNHGCYYQDIKLRIIQQQGSGSTSKTSSMTPRGTTKPAESDQDSGNVNLLATVVPVAVLTSVVVILIAVIIYRRTGAWSKATKRQVPDDKVDDVPQGDVYAEIKKVEGSKKSQGLDNPPQSEQGKQMDKEDPSRYISEEGLVYVTVAHAKPGKKTAVKPPKLAEPQQEEKVEYTTVNFDKTKT